MRPLASLLRALALAVLVCLAGATARAEEPPALAAAVAALPSLRLRGLMAIPEPTDDLALQRSRFGELRLLLEQLRGDGLDVDTLSMGMSADLEAAIVEGATIVRVGTALFGPRA